MTALFHDGELAVQERAGVRAQAARLSGMLAPPVLDGGLRAVLAERDFAVITGRDRDGRLWTSPLFAHPGFLDANDTVLRVHATPPPGDPLAGIEAGQPLGLIAIDFATRRRIRVNGTLIHAIDDRLDIVVDQAYGNCPRYIQQRHLTHGAAPASIAEWESRPEMLSRKAVEQNIHADTFFLGTVHPTRGADASHRGGPIGFVRVEGSTLWWPDYPGNDMFNSLGNLAVDDAAALLFIDFDTGATVHLSGTGVLEWTEPGIHGDDGGTGRRVRFRHDRAATGPTMDVRSGPPRASSNNPPLT